VTGRRSGALAEAFKLGAFLRRDLLVRLSYRGAIVSDWINLFAQALVFSFVSKLVHPIHINGGGRTSYIAFVTVGIAVAGFMAVGLARLVSAIQQEQSLGTLESLMVTPTTSSVVLLGSVIYDLIYVPFRTVIFLIIVSLVFNVSFAASGYIPALLILAAFIPFVWGLGSIASAGVLTFRRGSGAIGFLAFALTFTSGAYFPLALFPSWVAPLASINPIRIAGGTVSVKDELKVEFEIAE